MQFERFFSRDLYVAVEKKNARCIKLCSYRVREKVEGQGKNGREKEGREGGRQWRLD